MNLGLGLNHKMTVSLADVSSIRHALCECQRASGSHERLPIKCGPQALHLKQGRHLPPRIRLQHLREFGAAGAPLQCHTVARLGSICRGTLNDEVTRWHPARV